MSKLDEFKKALSTFFEKNNTYNKDKFVINPTYDINSEKYNFTIVDRFDVNTHQDLFRGIEFQMTIAMLYEKHFTEISFIPPDDEANMPPPPPPASSNNIMPPAPPNRGSIRSAPPPILKNLSCKVISPVEIDIISNNNGFDNEAIYIALHTMHVEYELAEQLAKQIADRLAKERERLAREKERLARETAEKERLAREKADRLAKEKAAEKERLAKIETDRIAAEKAKAEEEEKRLAKEKEEADRLAREKADRLARETAEKAKTEEERLAREKEEADQLARENADNIAKQIQKNIKPQEIDDSVNVEYIGLTDDNDDNNNNNDDNNNNSDNDDNNNNNNDDDNNNSDDDDDNDDDDDDNNNDDSDDDNNNDDNNNNNSDNTVKAIKTPSFNKTAQKFIDIVEEFRFDTKKVIIDKKRQDELNIVDKMRNRVDVHIDKKKDLDKKKANMKKEIIEKYSNPNISELFETLSKTENDDNKNKKNKKNEKNIKKLLDEAQLDGGKCATTLTLMCDLKYLTKSNKTLTEYLDSVCEINNNSEKSKDDETRHYFLYEGAKTQDYFVTEGKPIERQKRIRMHTQAVNLLYNIMTDQKKLTQEGKKGGKKTRRKYKKQTNHKKSRKSLFQQKHLNS